MKLFGWNQPQQQSYQEAQQNAINHNKIQFKKNENVYFLSKTQALKKSRQNESFKDATNQRRDTKKQQSSKEQQTQRSKDQKNFTFQNSSTMNKSQGSLNVTSRPSKGSTGFGKEKEITTINVVDRLNPRQQKTLFKKSKPSICIQNQQKKEVIQETVANVISSDEDPAHYKDYTFLSESRVENASGAFTQREATQKHQVLTIARNHSLNNRSLFSAQRVPLSKDRYKSALSHSSSQKRLHKLENKMLSKDFGDNQSDQEGDSFVDEDGEDKVIQNISEMPFTPQKDVDEADLLKREYIKLQKELEQLKKKKRTEPHTRKASAANTIKNSAQRTEKRRDRKNRLNKHKVGKVTEDFSNDETDLAKTQKYYKKSERMKSKQASRQASYSMVRDQMHAETFQNLPRPFSQNLLEDPNFIRQYAHQGAGAMSLMYPPAPNLPAGSQQIYTPQIQTASLASTMSNMHMQQSYQNQSRLRVDEKNLISALIENSNIQTPTSKGNYQHHSSVIQSRKQHHTSKNNRLGSRVSEKQNMHSRPKWTDKVKDNNLIKSFLSDKQAVIKKRKTKNKKYAEDESDESVKDQVYVASASNNNSEDLIVSSEADSEGEDVDAEEDDVLSPNSEESPVQREPKTLGQKAGSRAQKKKQRKSLRTSQQERATNKSIAMSNPRAKKNQQLDEESKNESELQKLQLQDYQGQILQLQQHIIDMQNKTMNSTFTGGPFPSSASISSIGPQSYQMNSMINSTVQNLHALQQQIQMQQQLAVAPSANPQVNPHNLQMIAQLQSQLIEQATKIEEIQREQGQKQSLVIENTIPEQNEDTQIIDFNDETMKLNDCEQVPQLGSQQKMTGGSAVSWLRDSTNTNKDNKIDERDEFMYPEKEEQFPIKPENMNGNEPVSMKKSVLEQYRNQIKMQKQKSSEEPRGQQNQNQVEDQVRERQKSPPDKQLRDLSAERMVFKKKNAFPSMLDSGIQTADNQILGGKRSMGHKRSLESTLDKISPQRFSKINPARQRNENQVIDIYYRDTDSGQITRIQSIEREFDTVTNPNIAGDTKKAEDSLEKAASPDKSKQGQLLVIGFEEKPKGRNPLMSKNQPSSIKSREKAPMIHLQKIPTQDNSNTHSRTPDVDRRINRFKKEVFSPKIISQNEVQKQISNMTPDSQQFKSDSKFHSPLNIKDTSQNLSNLAVKQAHTQIPIGIHQSESHSKAEVLQSAEFGFGNLQNNLSNKKTHDLSVNYDKIDNHQMTKSEFASNRKNLQENDLIISDDMPNLQELFHQKKKRFGRQSGRSGISREPKLRDLRGEESPIPNPSEGYEIGVSQKSVQNIRNDEQSNFDAKSGFESKSAYNHLYQQRGSAQGQPRKAKTKEELAKLRRQMMKSKFKSGLQSNLLPGQSEDISQGNFRMDTASNLDLISNNLGPTKNLENSSNGRNNTRTPGMLSRSKRSPNANRMGNASAQQSDWQTSQMDYRPTRQDLLLSRLASGQKQVVDKKAMKKLTARNFENLPEQKKKREDEKRKAELAAKRQRQVQYKKELDQRLRSTLLKKKEMNKKQSEKGKIHEKDFLDQMSRDLERQMNDLPQLPKQNKLTRQGDLDQFRKDVRERVRDEVLQDSQGLLSETKPQIPNISQYEQIDPYGGTIEPATERIFLHQTQQEDTRPSQLTSYRSKVNKKQASDITEGAYPFLPSSLSTSQISKIKITDLPVSKIQLKISDSGGQMSNRSNTSHGLSERKGQSQYSSRKKLQKVQVAKISLQSNQDYQ